MSFPTKITAYKCGVCGCISADVYTAQICCEPDECDAFKCSDCGEIFGDLTDATACCTTEYVK